MTGGNYITVRQLNLYLKSVIESDVRLSSITVCGEISNFKHHYASGHWYFTLKDNESSVRCVMFRSNAMRVNFTAQDGLSVLVKGRVSVYERDGQYQLYAEEMHEAGMGDLALLFEQTKEKLLKEGLFDQGSKRAVPSFCRRVAVVTSDTGAAVRDIINIMGERFPLCQIVLCPALVQGENAAKSMIYVLERVYALDNIDCIIIGRGGGSAEDLSAFNDEALARKIYESPVPIISAVGHETDFSISDFVADLRASTPSHAAQIVTPDVAEIYPAVLGYKSRFLNALNAKYMCSSERLERINLSPVFKNPQSIVENRQIAFDNAFERVQNAFLLKTERSENRLGEVIVRLDALSPLKTLSRGYVSVTKENLAVSSVKDLKQDDKIDLRFADGKVKCTVNSLSAEDR